jgi:hypothetical protein
MDLLESCFDDMIGIWFCYTYSYPTW